MSIYYSKNGRPVSIGRLQKKHDGVGRNPEKRVLQLSRLIGETGLQAKLKVGKANDRYEQEADRVAERVMAAPDTTSVTGALTGGITPLTAQRQEEEEEAQPKRLQRQEEEEEEAQPKLVQRQTEGEEEEEIQPKRLQRQEEEEEGAQPKLVQRQPEEEEEEIQPKRLQRQEEEEEEVQPKLVRRQPEEEEEEAQPKRLQRQEEEEEEAQPKRTGTQSMRPATDLSAQVQGLRSGGRPLPQSERAFFEPRFGVDFSAVRVHEGGRASDVARSINARAFTVGQDLVFGAGQYAPGSAAGRKLLAHELTHVVQQGGGRSGKIQPLPEISRSAPNNRIQRRRLPKKSELAKLLSGRNQTAHLAGLVRLLKRTMALLNAKQKLAIKKKARGKLTPLQFAKLPSTQQHLLMANALYKSWAVLRYGDPALAKIGPRNAAERAKLKQLVTATSGHLKNLATGSHNASIIKIFGAGNLGTVKTNYANAKKQMLYLYRKNKIVTDRSGYSDEVGLGGYANSKIIMLSNDCFDKPTAKESIVTLLHESMHAGNANITDHIYADSKTTFPTKSAAIKLTNAAHYEIPLRRHLKTKRDRFGTITFIPAGTTVGGVTAASLTPLEKGVDLAEDRFRRAWDVGVSLHEFYMNTYLKPQLWRHGYRRWIPYWSKVERLTVHNRSAISSRSSLASRKPITSIDLALSEGVSRKLSQVKDAMPDGKAAVEAYLISKMTSKYYRKIKKNKYKIRDKLLRLLIRHKAGQITGGIIRDMAVVRTLAKAYDDNTYAKIMAPRNPSRFRYP